VEEFQQELLNDTLLLCITRTVQKMALPFLRE